MVKISLDETYRKFILQGEAAECDNITVPPGWEKVFKPEMDNAGLVALALRNSGFMTHSTKIPGIKLIRQVTGAGLAESKNAWEKVFNMYDETFRLYMNNTPCGLK